MFLLLAQRIQNNALGSFGNQTGVQFLSKLIPAVMGAIFVVGVVIFVFTFLLGAIEWISSGGDKGKVEGAKQKLTNSIIGLTLLLGFFAILSFTECFFGIGLRTIDVGPFNISLSGSATCSGGGGGPTGSTTGGGQGGTGTTPSAGVGVSACGCSNGGCAQAGAVGLGNDGQCWTCYASDGWKNPVAGTCPVISCVATCQ